MKFSPPSGFMLDSLSRATYDKIDSFQIKELKWIPNALNQSYLLFIMDSGNADWQMK